MLDKVFRMVSRRDLNGMVRELERTGINVRNIAEQSLLHYAIVEDADDIAEELIRRGIDLNLRDDEGSTALHNAPVHNKFTLAKRLLESGARLDIADNDENEPLFIAVHEAAQHGDENHGKYRFVKLFMDYGADPYRKSGGVTALDFAREVADGKLVNILEKKQP